MKPSKKTGIKRIFYALFYALKGLKTAFFSETAFRQEVLLLVLLTPIGYYFSKSIKDFLILFAVLLLVLIAELFNSSIEKLTDLVHPSYHNLAGKTKDFAAAAVFLSICFAAIIWIIILFFP